MQFGIMETVTVPEVGKTAGTNATIMELVVIEEAVTDGDQERENIMGREAGFMPAEEAGFMGREAGFMPAEGDKKLNIFII